MLAAELLLEGGPTLLASFFGLQNTATSPLPCFRSVCMRRILKGRGGAILTVAFSLPSRGWRYRVRGVYTPFPSPHTLNPSKIVTSLVKLD